MKITVLPLLYVLVLAGCQTTTNVNTSPMTDVEEVSSTDDYDREKAARKRLALAMQYLQRGRMDDAKRNLDKALEHDDDLSDVYFGLGYYYQQVREYGLARQAYRKAMNLEPGNANYQNSYGAFLCAMREYKEAETYFLKAIDNPSFSDVASAYENAGICSQEAGDYGKAEQYYVRALRHNKRLPKSLLALAELEFEKESFKRAEQYLSRYEAIARHVPRSLWLGIQIARELGDRNTIATYGLKLEQLYPDSVETGYYLSSKQ